MPDVLKILKDKLTLIPDQDDTRYGCEFSQESMDAAPAVAFEEDE